MTVFGRHSDTEALNERDISVWRGDGLGAVGLHGDAPEDSTASIPVVEDDPDAGTSLVDEVDLAADPFADDLTAQLAARAPRRYVTRTTAVLAALVLATGGFLAGAQVQKHYGVATSSSTTANNPFAGFNGAARGNSGGGAGAAAGSGATGAAGAGTGTGAAARTGANATTGTVKLVDGTTVYIQTSDGQTITVRTNPSTAVQVSQKGALTDLAAGATVTVEGSTGTNGEVTATKVTKN